MNIIEATKLAKQGKKITRSLWRKGLYIYIGGPYECFLDNQTNTRHSLETEDLLANDWKEVGLLSFDELEYNKIYRVESHTEHEIYPGDIVRLALQNQFGAYNSIRERFALLTIQSDRKIETDGYYLDYAKKLKYREVTLTVNAN